MTTILLSWPVLSLLLALWCGRTIAVCDRVGYPEMVVVEPDYELVAA